MKTFKLNLDWLSNDKIIQNMNAQELSFKLGHNEYSDLVSHIHFYFEPN